MFLSLVHALYIVAQTTAQRSHVDLLNAAAAGNIERVRRGGAHGNARTHDAYARKRGTVSINATAGSDDILRLGRNQTAERHIVHVVICEGLPDIAIRPIVQLDRPCGARYRIRKASSGTYIIDAELLASYNPTRLPNSRQAVAADPRIDEC